MGPKQLAIILAPTILRRPKTGKNDDPADLMSVLATSNQVVLKILNNLVYKAPPAGKSKSRLPPSSYNIAVEEPVEDKPDYDSVPVKLRSNKTRSAKSRKIKAAIVEIESNSAGVIIRSNWKDVSHLDHKPVAGSWIAPEIPHSATSPRPSGSMILSPRSPTGPRPNSPILPIDFPVILNRSPRSICEDIGANPADPPSSPIVSKLLDAQSPENESAISNSPPVSPDVVDHPIDPIPEMENDTTVDDNTGDPNPEEKEKTIVPQKGKLKEGTNIAVEKRNRVTDLLPPQTAPLPVPTSPPPSPPHSEYQLTEAHFSAQRALSLGEQIRRATISIAERGLVWRPAISDGSSPPFVSPRLSIEISPRISAHDPSRRN